MDKESQKTEPGGSRTDSNTVRMGSESPRLEKRPIEAVEGADNDGGAPDNFGKRSRHNNKNESYSNKKDHRRKGKKADLGRGEYHRSKVDKRQRNEEEQNRRRELQEAGIDVNPALPKPFSAEEIAQEERKPKRKVAVLIGYSGTGYKGMQISNKEKTIEGDIFKAFVEAGAISKANADDPKKSQFVRCARTDKGVHAAGNVISLKLIVEDPEIVQKINDCLDPQIRIWGIHRTTSSFSCYGLCDSRWYEYLLPTHVLLPPRSSSFMGKTLPEMAKEAGDFEGYSSRVADVASFWDEFESTEVPEILNRIPEDIRPLVEKAYFDDDSLNPHLEPPPTDVTEEMQLEGQNAGPDGSRKIKGDVQPTELDPHVPLSALDDESLPRTIIDEVEDSPYHKLTDEQKDVYHHHLKELRNAYRNKQTSWRINKYRRDRLQEALSQYEGTRNFHNYTIHKTFKDPSTKRHIKSFEASEPFMKNGSEWISLKVHGQSFMMHQIRKMVAMAVLTVRCNAPISLIEESFKNVKLAIPKAPGLGLLLERPVFDFYNNNQAVQNERDAIDFAKYEDEIEAFKQREIYEQIWRVEEEKGEFYAFFKHIDSWRDPEFMYLTSKGVDSVRDLRRLKQDAKRNEKKVDSDDEEAGDS